MQIVTQITKITILSMMFTLILQISAYAVSVNDIRTQPSGMTQVQDFSWTWDSSTNSNKYKYKNSQVEILGSVWAALATNVWTQYTKNIRQNQAVKWEINSKWQEKWEIVVWLTPTAWNNEHMSVIQEYYNLLATNIKDVVDWSEDRSSTLSTFTNQLEYRYKLAVTNVQALNERKTWHIQELTKIKAQVQSIKVKINRDFRNFDANATDKNIKNYLELKKEYDFHRTQIIFINQYIKQYDFLNWYNKQVLDVLIINRDAIIKDSFVVIPDTGSRVLKEMNLIISEQEFKWE